MTKRYFLRITDVTGRQTDGPVGDISEDEIESAFNMLQELLDRGGTLTQPDRDGFVFGMPARIFAVRHIVSIELLPA